MTLLESILALKDAHAWKNVAMDENNVQKTTEYLNKIVEIENEILKHDKADILFEIERMWEIEAINIECKIEFADKLKGGDR